VGRAQAQLVSEQSAPVVRDQADLVEFERVQERDDVGEQLLAGVSGRRCVGPAGAAQIRADHPVALGEPRDDPAPLPPVLRPAVHAHHRLARAGLGVVEPDAAGVGIPVFHAWEGGQLAVHDGRSDSAYSASPHRSRHS
jgi:hypothetical protein